MLAAREFQAFRDLAILKESRRVKIFRHTALRRLWGGGLFRIPTILFSGGIQQAVHVKPPAITAPAAEAHAVRFIKLTVTGSVIPLEERILHALHSEI